MNTNAKGNIAFGKAISDLMVRGYEVFAPLSEHGKVDLIGLNGNVLRFQVKYSSNGIVRNYSMGHNRKRTTYTKDDFDYYAVYLSELDIVIYVPSDTPPSSIRYNKPTSSCKSWWYEDFLSIGTRPEKRLFSVGYKALPQRRKVDWPDKEFLEQEIWKKPLSHIAKDFNVSDRMVKKWCEHYNIKTPGRGYWKSNDSQLVNRI